MGNSNYIKGRKKEYKIVKAFKDKGFDIVQRSAGSHSPIDIFCICKRTKEIVFIQSKPDDWPESKIRTIKKELDYLNGVWKISFLVL